MIEKGDWVRITRLCAARGRIGEVTFVTVRDDENYVRYQVDLFGEPRLVDSYFNVEIEKITAMQVIAEASR